MITEKLNVYKTCCHLTRLYNKLFLLFIIILIIDISMFFIITWIIPVILICILIGIMYHLYTLNVFIKGYIPIGHDIEVNNKLEKEAIIKLFCGNENRYQYAVRMFSRIK